MTDDDTIEIFTVSVSMADKTVKCLWDIDETVKLLCNENLLSESITTISNTVKSEVIKIMYSCQDKITTLEKEGILE